MQQKNHFFSVGIRYIAGIFLWIFVLSTFMHMKKATLWCSIYNEFTPMADDVEELEILSGESTVGGSPAATAMVVVGREEGATPLKHKTLLNQANL